ncbi:PCNA-associated factor isoform X1 [Octopus bimaculoides]|uniref:PCNA-associated factor isoform X1 n=1 Tax=Octopus bimaculoides TaxID=37653 RepID=UPI00071CA64C|nr:PCNA-associated factor isoform X1 [Octopus bimaculoides]|eukprot:XP_014772888.1 PREDICTED: PCNA-associated factor-like isoform X1 [Octopus bimaculoides]
MVNAMITSKLRCTLDLSGTTAFEISQLLFESLMKAVAARAPRKSLGPCTSSEPSSPSTSNKYSGGNPVCSRPTPEWQKNITNFFKSNGSNNNKSSENSTIQKIGDQTTSEESSSN